MAAPRLVAVSLALAAALAIPSCMQYPGAAEKLQKSVTLYNQAIRWQQWKTAASFIPAAKRQDFIAQKEATQDTLQVTEMEIRDVEHDDTVDPPVAKILVEFTWHRYPSLRVQQTRVRQTWKYLGDAWILDGQEEVVVEEKPTTAEQMF
jgi:hypothetical protein